MKVGSLIADNPGTSPRICNFDDIMFGCKHVINDAMFSVDKGYSLPKSPCVGTRETKMSEHLA